eukprot:6863009-Alexandrium_andersonii.AAC.1
MGHRMIGQLRGRLGRCRSVPVATTPRPLASLIGVIKTSPCAERLEHRRDRRDSISRHRASDWAYEAA